ncbi:hypothetical protein BHM03_00030414, partial [Ensete ventricosum]
YLVRVALPRFPRAIRRLRAKNRLRDPLPVSNSFSPCGEKERRDSRTLQYACKESSMTTRKVLTCSIFLICICVFLACIGSAILLRELPSIFDGTARLKAQQQDHAKATMAPKVMKGKYDEFQYICISDYDTLLQLQPPGKKAMNARDFWNGLRGQKLKLLRTTTTVTFVEQIDLSSMEMEKRKRTEGDGGDVCGTEAGRKGEVEHQAVTDEEVAEFFTILRLLHAASKSFTGKGSHGDKKKKKKVRREEEEAKKATRWRPSFTLEDFDAVGEGSVSSGGVGNDGRRVAEDPIHCDFL